MMRRKKTNGHFLKSSLFVFIEYFGMHKTIGNNPNKETKTMDLIFFRKKNKRESNLFSKNKLNFYFNVPVDDRKKNKQNNFCFTSLVLHLI